MTLRPLEGPEGLISTNTDLGITVSSEQHATSLMWVRPQPRNNGLSSAPECEGIARAGLRSSWNDDATTQAVRWNRPQPRHASVVHMQVLQMPLTRLTKTRQDKTRQDKTRKEKTRQDF